jgi:hypothetical protein
MRKVYPSTIALGSGGADPRVYLAMIVEYLTRVKPKLVYWLYYASPNRLLAERGNDWLDRYRRGEPALGVMEATPRFTAFLEKWHSEKRELYRRLEVEPRKEEFSLKNALKLTHLRDRLGLNQCVDIDQQMNVYQDLLVVARKTVESWGGKLVVVEQAPHGDGCALFDFTRSSDNWLRQQLHKAAGNVGVTVLDAYPPFLQFADPERLYYYPGSHYSPEGAKLFADLLIAYAKQHLK